MRTQRDNLRQLADRQSLDATECERLSKRLYELTAEWEPATARQRELRQNVLAAHTAHTGDSAERAEQLDELLDLTLHVRDLERTLGWIDQRRNRVLERLFER